MQTAVPLTYPDGVRQNLAAAYRILAKFGMDDLTYTHLSARVPNEDCFYIHPLGLLFKEVTASQLLKVTFDGRVIEGSESQYNKTGYVMHGSVYQNRPDVNAIFHLHTTAGIAVSAMECGLLPISQFSFHFYNRLAYHNYNSLTLGLLVEPFGSLFGAHSLSRRLGLEWIAIFSAKPYQNDRPQGEFVLPILDNRYCRR